MRGAPKTLIAVVAVLLLVAGLAACGGGDDSASTTAETAQSQAGSDAGGAVSAQGKAKGSGEDDSGKADTEAGSGTSGDGSSDFVPKQHSDSGGGSEQFRVKGGDNSVQEFGDEADGSERDEAAAVLHSYLDARAAGDWGAACSYMARSIVESFEKLVASADQIKDKSCANVMERLTNPAAKPAMKAEAEQADVGSLRIEGDRAFAIYSGPDGVVLTMPMTKEDGSWKVGSLIGTPLS